MPCRCRYQTPYLRPCGGMPREGCAACRRGAYHQEGSKTVWQDTLLKGIPIPTSSRLWRYRCRPSCCTPPLDSTTQGVCAPSQYALSLHACCRGHRPLGPHTLWEALIRPKGPVRPGCPIWDPLSGSHLGVRPVGLGRCDPSTTQTVRRVSHLRAHVLGS